MAGSLKILISMQMNFFFLVRNWNLILQFLDNSEWAQIKKLKISQLFFPCWLLQTSCLWIYLRLEDLSFIIAHAGFRSDYYKATSNSGGRNLNNMYLFTEYGADLPTYYLLVLRHRISEMGVFHLKVFIYIGRSHHHVQCQNHEFYACTIFMLIMFIISSIAFRFSI